MPGINAQLALSLSLLLTAACAKDKEAEPGAKSAEPARLDQTSEVDAEKLAAVTGSDLFGLLDEKKGALPAESPVGSLLGGGEAVTAQAPASQPDQKQPARGSSRVPAKPRPRVEVGPECKKTAGALIELVLSELHKKMPAARQKRLKQDRARMEQMLGEGCETYKWSPALHQCVRSVKTINELKRCNEYAPKRKRPSYVNEAPNALAPSGDPGCDALAAKALAVLQKKTPPQQRATLARMKIKVQNALAKKCADEKWPPSVRTCIERANDIKSLDQCDPARAH